MAYEITSPPVDLCRAVKCESCGKTTWAGCGKHIEIALKDVKAEDRCTCKEQEAQAPQAESTEKK